MSKGNEKLRTGQSLANRHRPKTWNDVCGHLQVVSRLKGMIKTSEIPNALLFMGPSGTGKTTLSRVFARYLNCEHNTSCGTCRSCKAMDAMQHPDYMELNCADARGIDEMRSVLSQARSMPMIGNLRIIVLDEFQQCTPQAAQAALKSLEEPPAHTLFILCTMSPETLIPAVLGRCQKLQLKRVQADTVADHVKRIANAEHIEIDNSTALLIAEATGGQLRDALQTLDAVSQALRGAESLSTVELEKLVTGVVQQAAGITDDLVATKALVCLHAIYEFDNKRTTLRTLLNSLSDVQNPTAFVNSMIYQNGYLIDVAVDSKNPAIYHTATNRTLANALDANVKHTANYGSKPRLPLCLHYQEALLALRQQITTAYGLEKFCLPTALATALQTGKALVDRHVKTT